MAEKPFLTIKPAEALFDQDVCITAQGLRFGERAWLRAGIVDEEGLAWTGEAEFGVTEDGWIDTSVCASLAGTYTGVDRMGLFWSMRPVVDGRILNKNELLEFIKSSGSMFVRMGRPALSSLAPLRVTFELVVNGAVVDTAEFHQLRVAPNVTERSLLDEGLAAKLFTPPGPPRGGIITITGSNGGYEMAHAPLLASHGYLAMSLALFGVEGVPEHMVKLPVEYMEKALDWMANALGHRRIGMIGWSKGAESVLVAASLLGSKVGAVASCLPCHVIMNGTDGTANYDQVGWTWKGRPLPYHLLATPEEAAQAMRETGYAPGSPLSLRRAFEIGYERVVPETVIPVEQARCPVLLLSGGDDQNWPSSKSAAFLADRLRAASFRHTVVHLDYPEAGHLISAPNTIKSASDFVVHPIRNELILCGGTPKENARASYESWPKILSFFADALDRAS